MALSLGVLTASMRLDSGQFTRGLDAAKRQTKQFQGDTEQAKSSVRGMTGALAKKAAALFSVAAALGAVNTSIQTFAAFEEKMVRVGGIAQATSADFEKMTETAARLGATTEFTALQAAEGMQFLAMAGQDANTVMKSIAPSMQLASAAGIELGNAADIVTNVMSAYQVEASQLGEVNDVLVNTFTSSNQSLSELGEAIKKAGPVASNFGLTVADTSAALGVLADSGIRGSEAGRGLRRVMAGLAKPTKEGGQALKRMGITLTDLTKDNFEGFIKKLAKAKKRMGDTKFVAESLRAFDVFGGPIAASLANGETTLERVRTAHERAGTAAKLQADFLATTSGKMTLLKSAAEGLATALGATLKPVVDFLAESMTSFVSKLTEAIEWARRFGVINEDAFETMDAAAAATASNVKQLDKYKKLLSDLQRVQGGGQSNLAVNTAINEFGGFKGAIENTRKEIARLQALLGKRNKLVNPVNDTKKAMEDLASGTAGVGDEVDKLAQKFSKLDQKIAAAKELKRMESSLTGAGGLGRGAVAFSTGAGFDAEAAASRFSERVKKRAEEWGKGFAKGANVSLMGKAKDLGGSIGTQLGAKLGGSFGAGIGSSIGTGFVTVAFQGMKQIAMFFLDTFKKGSASLMEPFQGGGGKLSALGGDFMSKVGAGIGTFVAGLALVIGPQVTNIFGMAAAIILTPLAVIAGAAVGAGVGLLHLAQKSEGYARMQGALDIIGQNLANSLSWVFDAWLPLLGLGVMLSDGFQRLANIFGMSSGPAQGLIDLALGLSKVALAANEAGIAVLEFAKWVAESMGAGGESARLGAMIDEMSLLSSELGNVTRESLESAALGDGLPPLNDSTAAINEWLAELNMATSETIDFATSMNEANQSIGEFLNVGGARVVNRARFRSERAPVQQGLFNSALTPHWVAFNPGN